MDKNKLVVKDKVSVEEFIKLRNSVGFQSLDNKQAEKVLKNTAHITAVYYENTAVGFARLLFDYGTDAYLTDVIVSPKCQGMGIGRIILEDIIKFLKENKTGNVRIACSLYANKGKEEFYEKFGFEKLPSDKYGHGMIVEI